MLALHAAWESGHPGALVLWAEAGPDTDRTVVGPPRPRSRPRGRETAEHPFAASADAIVRAVAPVSERASRGAALVRLPSRGRTPEPSPELRRVAGVGARASTGRQAALGLRSFRVPALRFPPGDAVDALLAFSFESSSSECSGASVHALARIAHLALEVVCAGRVVPALTRHATGRFESRWEPLLQGIDATRLTFLSRSLPPACRCLEGSGETASVARHAFFDFVDVLCRDALWETEGARALGGGPTGPATPVASWVGALSSRDGGVTGDPLQLAALERSVEEWRAPLVTAPSSWRLCFRLHEPVSDGESDTAGVFSIELLLQAVDDPSLVVAAPEVWRAGTMLQRAARTQDAPSQVLLTELGRAVAVFPELDQVLAQPEPSVLGVDAAGAHRFLSETAPALDVAGFGVLVPSWWRHPTLRLGARLRASRPMPGGSSGSGSSRLGAEGVVSFEWEAAVGDQTLSISELRRLAALKVPLVQVRGQWVELRADEVDRLVALLEAGPSCREMSVLDVVRLAAGVGESGPGVPVVGVEASGGIDDLLGGGTTSRIAVRTTPTAFCGTLRPYQRRAVAWIEMLERAGLGACLADDMGLGKTATVLGVLAGEVGGTDEPGPTLVVCPTSVVGNWRDEVERFVPGLSVVVHHGPERARDTSARALRDADVIVTSYPLVARDEQLLAAIGWRRIVLDEAQQVKNPFAAQSRSVRALHASRRIALTGTPVENRLEELWSIMEFLNPGLLGTLSWFRTQIAVPFERYGDEDAEQRLALLVRPFLLRRLKTDPGVAGDLPEKVELKVRCTLTREQASLYQAVVDEMLVRIDESHGIERKGLVLSTILRLKQVCDHPALFTGDGSDLDGRSGKLERTVEVLEEVLEAGEKALVFTQFAEMGALLSDHLCERLGCRVAFLHGGVPRARREEMVASMQSPGSDLRLMVLSLRAGGTGLNLTAANHVVHFDRWWNPAVEDQATDRTHRIGQRRDVLVRKLVCAGTIEDRIDGLIESKRALSKRAVGSGDGWLTELSTADLAAALALSVRVGELT